MEGCDVERGAARGRVQAYPAGAAGGTPQPVSAAPTQTAIPQPTTPQAEGERYQNQNREDVWPLQPQPTNWPPQHRWNEGGQLKS